MRQLTTVRVNSTLLRIATVCLIAFLVFFIANRALAVSTPESSDRHLLMVHDRGVKVGVMTSEATLRDALAQHGIAIADNDLVEPGLDEPLVAKSYDVNIYRARPVLVVDGNTSRKILSPYQTAKQIARDATIDLQSEDRAVIEPIQDVVTNGPGIQVTIDRAVPFTLMLYGTKTQAYTQAKTVGEMLHDKDITLDTTDTLTVSRDTPIEAGMTVAIWRDGEQTVTEERTVDFSVEQVFDSDQPVGYRKVKTKGVKGIETVAYQVVMDGAHEVSRKKIRSIVTRQPIKQVEVVGTRPSPHALTRSKGAHIFVDSNGVAHRETYYDLPMNIVMGACGGGTYSVRADGAKVDKDGYILVAAHLGNYPRCSIVETSMGLGKVYDTGGFAAVHPHGFDLATDWTNSNGV